MVRNTEGFGWNQLARIKQLKQFDRSLVEIGLVDYGVLESDCPRCGGDTATKPYKHSLFSILMFVNMENSMYTHKPGDLGRPLCSGCATQLVPGWLDWLDSKYLEFSLKEELELDKIRLSRRIQPKSFLEKVFGRRPSTQTEMEKEKYEWLRERTRNWHLKLWTLNHTMGGETFKKSPSDLNIELD
jgi:hypothetical protein